MKIAPGVVGDWTAELLFVDATHDLPRRGSHGSRPRKGHLALRFLQLPSDRAAGVIQKAEARLSDLRGDDIDDAGNALVNLEVGLGPTHVGPYPAWCNEDNRAIALGVTARKSPDQHVEGGLARAVSVPNTIGVFRDAGEARGHDGDRAVVRHQILKSLERT